MPRQVMIKERTRWYAVYTKSRWEKKVHQLLTEQGVEAYCPLNKVRRQWSDRIKTIEEPLFKSYVFVRIAESDMTRVRMTNGVVNFVYWLGKPAVIRDREIETIRKFLNEYDHLEVQPIELEVSDRVVVEEGVFMHKEATVLRILRKKVVLRIESLGYAIIAQVRPQSVALVSKKPV